MEPKLWFFFLMLCGFLDVAPSQWSIDVPSKITAVQGSCAVIPCQYAHPKISQILRRKLALWKTQHKLVLTNHRLWNLFSTYKKRARFLGNINAGNCTLMLDGVRSTDIGPFYFSIIRRLTYRKHTFSKNTVSINVLRRPPPPALSVNVSGSVTASCSVSHVCPLMPPRFSWSRSGWKNRTTTQVNKWLWTTKSVLTFAPAAADNNSTLQCTVHHRGGKKAVSSVILSVN